MTDTVKETVQRTVGPKVSPQPQVPLSGTVDLLTSCTMLVAYISFCEGASLKSMGYQTCFVRRMLNMDCVSVHVCTRTCTLALFTSSGRV